MDRLDRTLSEFHLMEEEARGEGLLQSLHPLGKFVVTVSYLIILLSFDKYDLEGVLLMGAYPVLLFTLGRIPLRPMWRRMALILVPVCLVGIANPFFDRTEIIPGNSFVTGGMVSMASLLLKGLFSVSAAYLFMVTTTMDDLCRALRKIGVPSVLVTVVMMIYRYLTLLLSEVKKLRTSYQMRAPGQKGVNFRFWGPMAGMLLLRSYDRSDLVYQSMVMRGFEGEFPDAHRKPFSGKDILFVVLTITVSLFIRFIWQF